MERYDPAQVELAGSTTPSRGDIGMHFLCAPTDTPVHGFTLAVITTVMDMLFADPAVRRVVVEPDVRNTAVHALNEAVGFRVDRPHQAGEGRPAELLHPRAVPATATARDPRMTLQPDLPPPDLPAATAREAVAHLTPERWETATRLLMRKALAEFTHERLLTPRPLEGAENRYAVRSDDGATEYRFTARRFALDHWQVEADSVTRHRDGDRTPPGRPRVRHRAAQRPGPRRATILPVYLEEISSHPGQHRLQTGGPARERRPSSARSGFQDIESGMTEGHPCFIANNGRLGFDIAEYRAYAPETGAPVRLIWVAARRDRATFTACTDLSYDKLILSELSGPTLRRFSAAMSEQGLDLDDYYLIPVHPWQWWNKLSVTFAAELAQRHLFCLGHGDDEYLAQQSIRTFFNTTHPTKHYVKTALSVLNMGFLRGLSASYMEATPAINDWLADLVARDEVLRSTGLEVLRERAAVGYHPAPYEAAAAQGFPVPEDARRPVAREPGPVPERGREAGHHGLAAAHRPGRKLLRRGPRRTLGAGPPPTGCAATSTPTSPRCCTASTPTTWRSCRTARTSSSSWTRTASPSAPSSRTWPRK